MNPEVLQDLYDRAISKGYSKSIEEFTQLISSNQEVLDDNFNYVKTKGYSKDISEFSKLVGIDLKKKEVTDSASLDGGVVSKEFKGFDSIPEQKSRPIDELGMYPTKEEVDSSIKSQTDIMSKKITAQKEREEKRLAGFTETDEDALAKLKEQEARDKMNYLLSRGDDNEKLMKSENFVNSVSKVDVELANKEQDEVSAQINKEFGKYGFVAKPVGQFGRDAVVVRTLDGKESKVFEVDNFTDAESIASSEELRTFIKDHARNIEKLNSEKTEEDLKIEDQLNKSIRARQIRPVAMVKSNGTESTVKFMSYEEDGNYYVAPTLFPKDPDNPTSKPSDWYELKPNEAIYLAKQRGEVFKFNTEDDAQDFAEGSWKNVSTADVEADKFYADRGLNYSASRKAFDDYQDVNDEIEFIEDTFTEEGEEKVYKESLTDEEKEEFGDLYVNGKLRSDVGEYIKVLEKKRDNLSKIVMLDDDEKRVREEFDEYLIDRIQKTASVAAESNRELKVAAFDLDSKIKQSLNVGLKDLINYTPKSEYEYLLKDKYTQDLVELSAAQKQAAAKYEVAKTFYSKKVNKSLRGDYVDNLEGFNTSVSNGYKRGQAMEVILAIALGIEDLGILNATNSKEKNAKLISKYLGSQSSNVSRVSARFAEANTGKEVADVILDDPLEWMFTLAGESLSQIVPYGTKVVLGAAGAGTAIGAGAGLVGGPLAPVTSTAGALTGLGYGIRTGMGATSFAMEYTNAVLEGLQKYDFNYLDPKQVEKGLEDQRVWDYANDVGAKRGAIIGTVDFVTGGVVGKLFKPGTRLASKGARMSAFAAERAVFDPAAEGVGEYLAQVGSGQEVDFKEIIAEMGGAFGNQISSASFNVMMDSRRNTNLKIADDLANDLAIMVNDKASDSRVSNWANNMLSLGKINEDQNQKIQENVGIRRQVNELLSVSKVSTLATSKTKNTRSRLALLIEARNQLTKTTNTKEIFKNKIRDINIEIAEIAETNKIPDTQTIDSEGNIKGTGVDLSSILGKTERKKSAKYMWSSKIVTRREFLNKLENLKSPKIKGTTKVVDDPEMARKLNAKLDAFQEPSTTEVDVPQQARDGKAMGVRDTEEQVVAKDEVQTQEAITISPRLIEASKTVAETFTPEAVVEDVIFEETQESTGFQIVTKPDNTFAVIQNDVVIEDNIETKDQALEVSNETAFEVEADTEVEAAPILLKPLKKHKTALDNETLSETDRNGIIAYALDKKIKGKKLTPFENTIIDTSNQETVANIRISLEDITSKQQTRLEFDQDVADLEAFINQTNPQFQLSTKVTSEEKKQALEDEAIRLMEDMDGQEISEDASVFVPDSKEERPSIPVSFTENTSFLSKIKKFKLKDLYGKSINLLMADKLKVELQDPSKPHNIDTNPYIKMGGNFFPLMEGLFGKVAWASITDAAATKIIKGAMNGDISVVYNMGSGGIDSNIAMATELNNLIPEKDKAEVFKLMQGHIFKSTNENINKKVKNIFIKSDNLIEAFEALQKGFDVKVRAAAMQEIVPESLEIEAGTPLNKKMKSLGISLEVLRENNTEQFVDKLPIGVLTMVVEVTNKDGVKVSELKKQLDKKLKNKEITKKEYDKGILEIIASAKMSQDQQKKEGMQTHPNYPEYIRGRAIAVMEETTPFYNVIEKYSSQVEKRQAGIEKKKSGNVKKDATPVEQKIYEQINKAKTLEKQTKLSTEKKIQKFKDIHTIIKNLLSKTVPKLKGQLKKDTRALFKEILESTSSAKIKILLAEAEIPFADMVKYTTAQALAAAGTSASTTGTTSYTVEQNIKAKYDNFVSLLSKSFPSVEIITNQSEFDFLLDEPNVVALTTKQQRTGNKIYGAVYQGKLYLNPASANFNTPIHEFGHIWNNIAKQQRPELYKKGLELIEADGSYVSEIENSPEYKRVIKQMKKDGATEQEIREFILEEALATAIGDKGESFANASIARDFKDWLNKLYSYVKSLVGLSQYTDEQIQDITLDEFLQGVVVDLLSGNQVFKDAQVKKFSSQLQLMTGSNTQNIPMNTIISIGRSNGWSDAVIKEVLKGKKFKASDINKAMVVNLSNSMFEDVIVPAEFGNIEGGMPEGQALFDRVRKKLKAYAEPTVTQSTKQETQKEMIARVTIIRSANPSLFALTDEEIAKRYPRIGLTTTINTPPKTNSQIRAKALELLKADSVFKSQPEIIQQQLLIALDKTIGTRANKSVSEEINALKQRIKDYEKGIKDIQGAKMVLMRYVRKALPKSNLYSNASVTKIASRIAKATPNTLLSDVEYVNKQVDAQREVMKKSVIKKMAKLVSDKSKKRISQSNKSKSKGIAAEAQAFFEQSNIIFKLLKKNDVNGMTKILEELSINEGVITQAIIKELQGEKLTVDEQRLVNLSYAFDNFSDLENMTLEETVSLYNSFKDLNAEGIRRYKTRRAARAMQIANMNNQAKTEISEGFKEVIDKDVEPKNTYQLSRDQTQIAKLYADKKYLQWIKAYKDHYRFGSFAELIRGFKNNLKHLGTLTNKLDKVGDYFTENVYKRLNRADEANLKGYFRTMDKLDNMANSVDGVTKGFRDIRNKIYESGTMDVKVRKTLSDGTMGSFSTSTLSRDQLLRVYSLYQNENQKIKLERQGFNDKVMQDVAKFLGKEVTEFADKMIYFLSNEYYNETNDVYRNANDVNLNFVQNYFPTQTISSNTNMSSLLADGDFNAIFNAESSPALKRRSDSKGDVVLKVDFTATLIDHVKAMERYKAYAIPTKMLQGVFSDPYVKSLLDSMNLQAIMKQAVNYSINPDSYQQNAQNFRWVTNLQSKYTSFALGLKLMQIPKQMSSFVNAYENYQYRKEGQTPGLDIVMFMVDASMLYANLLAELAVIGAEKVSGKHIGLESRPLTEAMGMSASFRKRIELGVQGDLVGLEAGQPTFKNKETNQALWAKLGRGGRKVAASPTVIGDVAGVMGYMINYRRNIKNGMNNAKALEEFNDYNATQQSRRATEKIPLQMNANVFTRSFLMFGSTLFLQMNKVMSTGTNIMRGMNDVRKAVAEGDIKKAKQNAKNIKSKDIRGFYLNLAVANVMFTAAANIFKLTSDDDEDREVAFQRMQDAMFGLNLAYSIPFIGEAVEKQVINLRGERREVDAGVNPIKSISTRISNEMKYEDSSFVYATAKNLTEIGLGVQLDPVMALGQAFTGEFDEEDMYDLLGVSYSYRTKKNKSKSESSKSSGKSGKSGKGIEMTMD